MRTKELVDWLILGTFTNSCPIGVGPRKQTGDHIN